MHSPRVAVALALCGLSLLPATAGAQGSAQRTISVAGDASLTARNDAARIGFAVRARSATRPDAVRRSSARLRRVLGALEAAGVAAQDLRTGSVSVSRRRDRRGRPVGAFEARQSVRATVREAARAGVVVRAAVRVGAAPVEGPTFFLTDAKALFRRALASAFRDARANAAQLAAEAGLTLGPAIRIRDSGFEPGDELGQQDAGGGRLEAAPRSGAPPPTRIGRTRVSATVFVVFEAG